MVEPPSFCRLRLRVPLPAQSRRILRPAVEHRRPVTLRCRQRPSVRAPVRHWLLRFLRERRAATPTTGRAAMRPEVGAAARRRFAACPRRRLRVAIRFFQPSTSLWYWYAVGLRRFFLRLFFAPRARARDAATSRRVAAICAGERRARRFFRPGLATFTIGMLPPSSAHPTIPRAETL